MVARLEGMINGKEIIFSRKGGDMWECTFPSSDACEIVIELRAYDEAGNFCYSARYMLLFDSECLELRLLPLSEWLERMPEASWLECIYPCDCVLIRLTDEITLECICPCDYWLEYLTQEMRYKDDLFYLRRNKICKVCCALQKTGAVLGTFCIMGTIS